MEYLDFGEFRVDPVNRRLLYRGDSVSLTPRAFDLLHALADRPQRLVTREQLLSLVWPDATVGSGTITQNIYTLRRALSATGDDREHIETLPRRGYRFGTPVRRVRVDPALAPDPAELEALAVLPFTALGMGDEGTFVGLAMADAVITRLTRLQAMTVRPSSAIYALAGRSLDPDRVARDLRVDATLHGTIQRTETRIRVTVQLVGARTRSPLWAETFDVAGGDVLAIQDAISRRVVDSLRLSLTSEQRRRLDEKPRTDPAAHRSYVKGRFFWNQRTGEGIRRAMEYFRQAAQADPGYALPRAGLADCHALLPLYDDVLPRESFPAALEEAGRALEIDDEVAEAHTSMAYCRMFYTWDWAEAERGFDRAVALDPSYPTAHHWRSFLMSSQGRHDEALESMQEAVRLDPSSLPINADLGMVLYFARRTEAAVEQLDQTLELNPSFAYAHFGLALALEQSGDLDAAIRIARNGSRLLPDSSLMLSALGRVLAVAGRREEALDIVRRLAEQGSRRTAQHGRFALIHAGLGDRKTTLEHVREAVRQRSRFAVFLDVWPGFDALAGDPGFEAILVEAGLPGGGRHGPGSDPASR